MKKISYYLIFIVVIGVILISFWVYQKYFKEEAPTLLLFNIERGNLQEVVKVRGEVVAQKEFDLEFPFSGIVEKVFVEEGQAVNRVDPLIKLETTEYEIEIKRLKALLVQNKANLDKLMAGATEEEIRVLETKVLNAQIELTSAKQNLEDIETQAKEDLDAAYQDSLNTLDDAYLKAYNAQNSVGSIQRTYFSGNDQEGIKVRENQDKVKAAVSQIKTYLDTAKADPAQENIDTALSQTKDELSNISDALIIIRDTCEEPSYRNVISSTDKSSLDIHKLNINTALTNLTNVQQDISSIKVNNESNINTAQAKVSSAGGSLKTAEDQLNLKKAEARVEDIEIDRAKIEETESQIEIIQEKIKKSTLLSPLSAKITKVWLEPKEIFKPGQTAISLSTAGHKIQADISELEIRKVREVDGNDVLILLDAFPGQEFKGRVVSIEPKEIIKEGDKYYRVNIYLEEHGEIVRSGMSADLAINISFKENVLKIPEFAVYKKGDKTFVKVLENDQQKEVEIETGISDGESIEVIKGLDEDQIIVVPAD